MKKILSLSVTIIIISSIPTLANAAARDTIKIVGSSTVYPFATVVAERFGKKTKFNTPVIESTGSGGGLKLFCKGIGVEHPDITNASRRIKQSEIDNCAKAGINEITEIKIGYDGIVIANSRKGQNLSLTKRQIFLALSPMIPSPSGKKVLVANPNKTWSDVDPSLPNIAIEVLGPPPSSGTRDAFAELAMEGGCKTFKWLADIKKQDKNRYKSICRSVREDGPYIEVGENDNLIVSKLNANPNALGVFGYSFLDQNSDTIQGSMVDGALPTFENIADGTYKVSRPLYFYVKNAHASSIPGIKQYVREFTSKGAIGQSGYLSDKGLIPMPNSEYKEFASAGKKLTPLMGL
ncbi:PstS family phosphate ABC transporter substrate-binding protein [Gammaproteobacteria bacterium]|nr:PstS family phosphate ABC transporter substrate-binding protein [Gammaproteobacteria bacterium]MDA9574780.1 PstS family phosphate ABC transporter substrate-binding protein [Gammaproteobacteria bacterium]MDB2451047.1 PstS family phosphate ABC transporter substrate-binding protein [Gammaproteobacteria bacterium]MDB2703917.1 PstS family phosphate ABC transporter substrate-binding protein [Gammaproteobacteria bacterium]